MSDWVRVIVDNLGSRNERSMTELRAKSIEDGYLARAGWNVHRKALCFIGDDAPGLACETTLVLDTSLWNRKAMLETLADLTWERPEEVFVFWKAEEDTSYSVTSLGLATDPLTLSRPIVVHRLGR